MRTLYNEQHKRLGILLAMKFKRPNLSKKKLIIITTSLVLLIGAAIGYVLWNDKKNFNKVPNVVTDTNTSTVLESLDINALGSDEAKFMELRKRATVYYAEGDYKKALAAYEQAKAYNQRMDESFLRSMVELAEKLNDTDKTNKYRQELIDFLNKIPLVQKSPAEILSLAQQYEASGNKRAAVEQYKLFLDRAKFTDSDEPENDTYGLSLKTSTEEKIKQLEGQL